jgi:hypothetical protein
MSRYTRLTLTVVLTVFSLIILMSYLTLSPQLHADSNIGNRLSQLDDLAAHGGGPVSPIVIRAQR